MISSSNNIKNVKKAVMRQAQENGDKGNIEIKFSAMNVYCISSLYQ